MRAIFKHATRVVTRPSEFTSIFGMLAQRQVHCRMDRKTEVGLGGETKSMESKPVERVRSLEENEFRGKLNAAFNNQGGFSGDKGTYNEKL